MRINIAKYQLVKFCSFQSWRYLWWKRYNRIEFTTV